MRRIKYGVPRIEFLLAFGVGVTVSSGVGKAVLDYLLPPVYAAENQEPSLEQLAQQWNMPLSQVQQIYKEMHQPVVTTLSGTSVREVTPYDYQQQVLGSGRPGLVLFYEDKPELTGANPSRGLASVYRTLERMFMNQINFFMYSQVRWELQSQNQYEKTFANSQCGVTQYPSVVMYSPWDLLKGETPQRNDGKVKRIDIWKEGFSKIQYWHSWYIGDEKSPGLKPWVEFNLIKDAGFVLRCNNTSDAKRINYR